MKKSDFRDYIKETIAELLSEEGIKPDEAKEYAADMEAAASSAERLQKTLTTEDIDDEDQADAAATKAASDSDSVSVISRKLQATAKEMKTVVNKWKQAEGEEKERLLARLKDLTKIKKELEGLL